MKTFISTNRPPRVSRRGFLGLCVGGACAAGGAALYARHVEPTWLRTLCRDVPMDGLKRTVRIAHLSDFHASDVVPMKLIEEAIDRTLVQQPDLICLTGDFVTRHLFQEERYAHALARLATTAPTYAIFGNHDGGPWAERHGGYQSTQTVGTFLQAAGITLLDNTSIEISVRDQPLRLVGVGDLWSRELDPQRAFAGPSSLPVVLLNHNPDAKTELEPFAWDLMLCGHTHGGQLRLPLVGTPFAPVHDHAFVDGLHRWKKRWIHISRGVGNLHGLRFNCRPEISLLDLQPTNRPDPAPASKP